MHMITDTAALQMACQRLAGEAFVTVDSEFIRDKTYYPQLCLVQLAGECEAYIIDPLAAGMDLAPLFALFADANVVKVFHACRQDLEIFYLLSGAIPAPLFDTQIAAGFCGYNYPSGFSKIVDGELRIQVKKGFAVADWNVRPLPQKILQYAIDDVLYLPDMWRSLSQKLEKNGRTEWARE